MSEETIVLSAVAIINRGSAYAEFIIEELNGYTVNVWVGLMFFLRISCSAFFFSFLKSG